MKTEKGRGIANSTAVSVAVAIIAVGVIAYVYAGGVAGSPGKGTRASAAAPLISFSADAYATEAAALLSAFSRDTGVPVAPVKSGGSFSDANQIAAGAPDDVFISVALSATDAAHLKSLSPNWAVGLASDEMVLAYSGTNSAQRVASQGIAASESNSSSAWNTFFASLTGGSVKVGMGSPAEDPAGLRGWLALEAAGYLYSGGNESAYTRALVGSGSNISGASAAALVAPLESGNIQFLFIYRSAAVAAQLDFIALDRHVNFGDPTLASFYSKFSYVDSAGVATGAPIVLCVTVPLGSTNTAGALRFVQYAVENAGALAPFGLQPLAPPRLYNNTAPPAAVRTLISQGLVVQGGSLP